MVPFAVEVGAPTELEPPETSLIKLMESVPFWTEVAPVKVLELPSVSVPVPVLVSPPDPAMTAEVERLVAPCEKVSASAAALLLVMAEDQSLSVVDDERTRAHRDGPGEGDLGGRCRSAG